MFAVGAVKSILNILELLPRLSPESVQLTFHSWFPPSLNPNTSNTVGVSIIIESLLALNTSFMYNEQFKLTSISSLTLNVKFAFTPIYSLFAGVVNLTNGIVRSVI